MSLSFAELARINVMEERIKALEAEAKRRKGGRPKKAVGWESVEAREYSGVVVKDFVVLGSTSDK